MLSQLLILSIIFTLCGSSRAELYMPVEDIQRGMKGVGRTVFQGTRIDTFGVEVLGVLRNVFGPKSDMILARCPAGLWREPGSLRHEWQPGVYRGEIGRRSGL